MITDEMLTGSHTKTFPGHSEGETLLVSWTDSSGLMELICQSRYEDAPNGLVIFEATITSCDESVRHMNFYRAEDGYAHYPDVRALADVLVFVADLTAALHKRAMT